MQLMTILDGGGSSDRRHQWLPRVLILVAIVIGAWLRVSNVSTVRERTPDERVYTAQAQRVARQGPSVIRSMAQEYLRSEEERLYPSPSRIGYMTLVAGAMKLSQRSDPQVGAWVSTLASVGTLGLVGVTAATHLNPWAGAAATFMLAVFPPDLAVARRAWTDSLVSLLTCLMLFCALAMAKGDHSRWVPTCFLAAGSALVLTKETALLVWGLTVGWLVFRRRSAVLPVLIAAVAVGALSLALLFWAVGGVRPFLDIQSGMGPAHVKNLYVIQYQTGPSYWILGMFWIASPATFLLAIVGLVFGPFVSRLRDRSSVAFFAVFSTVFLLLPFFAPGWLSLRFASPAFGPLCILAGAGLFLVVEFLRRRLLQRAGRVAVAVCSASILFAGYGDYRYFERWFVDEETADLSAAMVLATSRGRQPAARGSAPSLATPQTHADYLNESLALYRQKQFEESIAAARQAIALKPDYAEAYNNVAAAYAEMEMWDAAIEAAEEAIRINPDLTIARNNLAWARAEKSKADAARLDHALER